MKVKTFNHLYYTRIQAYMECARWELKYGTKERASELVKSCRKYHHGFMTTLINTKW